MPPEPGAIRIALTTIGSLDEGRRMAHLLVERRLAACVNIIPSLTSIYRWQGAVEEAQEVLLVMKTTSEQLPMLEAAVRELHSYEVPEFVVLEAKSVNQPYVDWLTDSVGN